MPKQNRDEFSEKTKLQIAKRAGWRCSYPSCRRPTVGSTSDGGSEINVGTAAHICAAAPGGPRYDPNQTPAQRSSAENGIWMCRTHGTAVDAKDSKFTVELLREWKAQAQKESWQRVMENAAPPAAPARSSEDELRGRLRAAAKADLDVFRRSDKWHSTAIALTLQVDSLSGAVSTSALATALTTLDDLILVAPPGTGKTTALFQIAEAVLANGAGSPIIVALGDWSTDGAGLLESILKRAAFRAISDDDVRAAAMKPGVILLLDGWNELDGPSRRRLAVEVERLQAELPELSFVISTRRQFLDVPFTGTRINVLPLTEKQQSDIAHVLRGDDGVRIVDQAWRTTGVRELVSIPLYLNALLALPDGAPFPTTKEEILRRFVDKVESKPQRAEALAEVTHGLHGRFLEGLAATATQGANTTIADSVARKSVSATEDALVDEGQITQKPQPTVVLAALVNYHVLMHVGEPAGYSFQHQQFLEWYASHVVERLMFASGSDASSREKLKAEILNQPLWEESILFACERLARGDQSQQGACAGAILDAFTVDPMLAADMIGRATDAIWARIGSTIKDLISRWHAPGKVDHAVRFMIRSGRPEFLEQVWPLITHTDNQVSLAALRAGGIRQFRPSVLGPDAAQKIAGLPKDVRKTLLSEIASTSGMDGLELATRIARNEPDSEVKAEVIGALAFRRADRHVAGVLRGADERVFDLVVRQGVIEEVDVADEQVRKAIEAARERQSERRSHQDRMWEIVYEKTDEDLSGEVSRIIAEMEFKEGDREARLLYEARGRYLPAIADGLIERLRAGRPLLYGADDLLASAGLSLEDDQLLGLALSTARRDRRAEAAASVLGPSSVGRMIEALLEAQKHLRDASGKWDAGAGERHQELLVRIAHARGSSLVAAVQARSPTAGNEEMAALSDLLSRHNGDPQRGRPFDRDALAAIQALAEDWGNRMLASGDATRSQFGSIASLVSRAPSVSLLPLLTRLLDEELRRHRALKAAANADGWRRGRAADEARTSYTHFYQRAFLAIPAAETASLMRAYLGDQEFGELAAQVLAAQWMAVNEPHDKRIWRPRVDFSRVAEKRAARALNPSATSTEADAIFAAVDALTADENPEDQKKQGVALGIVAAALPHGQRDTTIRKLISLAQRRSRVALLRNLILSGETIETELVKNGIAEVLKAAKKEAWILWEGYELGDWLRLLPFTTRPSEAFEVVRTLPVHRTKEDPLEGLIAALGAAPSDEAEDVLFRLAEADARLYDSREWREAVLRRRTPSAARRFVDLVASGRFGHNGTDGWQMAGEIGNLMGTFPDVRAYVYRLLKDGARTPGLVLLANAVAQRPDVDGILLLVKLESEHKRSFMSWRTIESVVTENIPSERSEGVYNIAPIPAPELRRALLAVTTDGGPADTAARCLRLIDDLRDRYGTPDSEPRHPDLASGKAWPILVPVSAD